MIVNRLVSNNGKSVLDICKPPHFSAVFKPFDVNSIWRAIIPSANIIPAPYCGDGHCRVDPKLRCLGSIKPQVHSRVGQAL
jgi:hypothetical protein